MSYRRPSGAGFAFATSGVALSWCALILVLTPQYLFATDRAWNGGSTVWGTTTNWGGGFVPVAGDNAVFNSTFTNQPTLGAIATVGGLWMTGSVGQNVTIGGASVLTLNGNTINGTAGLGILVDNANAFTLTINAPITLGLAQTWTNNSANLLTIGATNLNAKALTVNGSGNGTISGIISGTTGTLTKNGAGTWSLTGAGANTYTGTTTVNDGILQLNKTAVNAFAGSLAIGDGVGAANSAVTRWMQSAQAATTTAITLNADGWLDLNNLTQTIGTLTMTGGNVTTGTGTLTLGTGSSVTSNAAATSATISGKLALGVNETFTIADGAAAFDMDISAVISGAFSLTKSGAGNLKLSGVNTYTGSTTITAGTLTAGNAQALGLATTTLSLGGGTLDLATDTTILAHNTTLTANSAIASDRATAGAGITHTLGTLSIGAQTLGITVGSNVTSGTAGLTFGTTTFTGAAIFDTAPGTNLTLGALTGAFGVTKQNSGQLTLNTASARVSGPVTLSAGTLKLGSVSGLGTTGVTLALNGGTLDLAIGTTVNAYNTTVGGTTTIASDLAASGPGITHTLGTLSIGAQTLSLVKGSNVASGTAGLTFGATTLTGAAIFDTATSTLLTLGAFNDGGTTARTIAKNGAGTLTLGTAATSLVNGTVVDINAGTLNSNNATALGALATVDIADGATFGIGATQTIGALTNLSTVNNTGSVAINGAFTLTIGGTNNLSSSFSGVISGATGNLTKAGTGTLTLSGANTYSGATAVSAGTLNIQNATGLGSTAAGTTVSTGATLQLQGGITVGVETLSIGGTGAGGQNGALVNVSGTNYYGGLLTLTAPTTFSSDSGTLNLTNTGTITGATFGLTLTGAGSGGMSSIIGTPTGALIKSGAGTWTLSGTNTYSGGTTINGGTLAVSSDANLGGTTGALTLNAGILEATGSFTSNRSIALGDISSTFQVDSGQTFTVSTVITGAGTLNKSGAGTLVLSAANLFSGGTSVAAGTLQIGAVDRLLTTAPITISGGAFDLQTFTQAAGVVTLSSGSITGTGTGLLNASSFILQSGTASAILAGLGTVTKNTPGTVILSGSNVFTGSTTISAGTLQVNANNALGTVAGGTTVANGAVLKLNNVNYSTAEPVTLNGSGISNGGALANSGTSTFAGAINIATNATISAGGGTLNLTGGVAKNGTTLTIAGGGTVNITTNGITGGSPNSDLVIDGTTVVLSAANSYNGPTTVQNSGTLKLGNSNVLPTSPQTPLTVNTSSVFDLASRSDGVASLSGDSTAIVKNTSVGTTSTLTVNPGSGVLTTFAGVIAGTNGGAQGNVALQKTGAGTLTLTGANTFSGATTIDGGTLTAGSASGNALGSTTSITVNSGGTLLLSTANNQINDAATMTLNGGTFNRGTVSEGDATTIGVGALTLTASSHIDFGTGAVGVLTFASFAPGAFTLIIDNWTGTIAQQGGGSTDRLIFDSNQSLNLNSFNFTGYAGAVEFDLGNGFYEVVPAAVPEPATYISGFLAFAAILFHHRKQLGTLFRRQIATK
jgi:fibronectin-binding autotransporter adhesin